MTKGSAISIVKIHDAKAKRNSKKILCKQNKSERKESGII